jgi:ADP-heptose:LPS heptosyltransferase
LIKERYDYKIIVVGQENNKTINYITRGHSVVNLAAKLSIAELGCLLHKSRLFISNDSGPVHIAAALDTPVISIFGRGDKGLSPQRWRPLAEHSFYLHKDVGCRQCLAHNCQRDFLCLRSIKPEEVFELMQQILQEKGGAKK